MTYTAIPDDEPPSAAEQADLAELLRYIRMIRSHGGWGRAVITMKNGDLTEVEVTYTEKLGKPPPKPK